MTPDGLRVEHLDVPLGIRTGRPRLSWRLPAGGGMQSAYRLRMGDWESEWIESGQSVLVENPGPDTHPGTRVEWRVQVRTVAGESDWSAPGWWETGLPAAEWRADWVGIAEDPAGALA